MTDALIIHRDADLLRTGRDVDHWFQEVSELIAAAECLGNADPSAAERKEAEKNQRHEHGPGAFVRVRIMRAAFAKEGQVPEAEHIERREPRSQQADEPQDGAGGRRKKRLVENRVFAEEAGEGW